MTMQRREFLELAALGAAFAAAGLPARAAEPVAGLIFPPANYPLPPDVQRLYPNGVKFIGNGLGFNGMTIESYDEAIPRALPRAQELASQGANLISVFGSSITFYKGAKFNQELCDKVTALTGLPSTTQSNGLIDGLKHVNARRVAVATAYTDVVTDRLKSFLVEHGFEVASTKGPRLRADSGGRRERGRAARARRRVVQACRQSDALVMSCGGLRTLDVIVPLEKSIGVPVVSSTPHGLWHCARMLGVKTKIQGFGMVMAA